MAKEELVADFQTFAKALEETAGPVSLLMLMPVEPGTEQAWILLVSARTFDGQSQRESIKKIASYLNSSLSDAVRPSVKRVSILKSDDPFVRAMNSTVYAEHSFIDLASTVVGGVEIPRAIVFESKRIAA
jgi:hypothetical protein